MIKNKAMKKMRLMLLLGVSILVAASCSKEGLVNDEENGNDALQLKSGMLEAPENPCGSVEFNLIAGQHMDAGNVIISNDENFLYVTFNTTGYLMLKEVHVFVGIKDEVPVTKGKKQTPIPGQFPYKAEKLYINTYTIAIALEDIMVDCPIILAHAALSNGETAWGWKNENEEFTFEEYFGTNRWGYLGDYCIEECNDINILALKTRYVDTVANRAWTTTLYTGEAPFDTDWCKRLSLIEPANEEVYDMYDHYGSISGQTKTLITEGNLKLIITTPLENTIVKESYFYFGSITEFYNTFMLEGESCPDVLSFPFERNEAVDKTTQVINISLE